MADEQNIPGVPEGWRLLKIGRPVKGDWFVSDLNTPLQWNQIFYSSGIYAIIERIPKPKKRVLMVDECELSEKAIVRNVMFSQNEGSFIPLRFRIEERDA